MSKVAKRFWNHKRIAQDEARVRLKALGIITGAEAQESALESLFMKKAKEAQASIMKNLTKELWTSGQR